MDIKDIAEKIVFIPQTYKLGNKSFYTLVNETGYFDNAELINEICIEEALHEQPDTIKDWLELSGNKRTSGWYFSNRALDKYEVGCLPNKDDVKEQIFSDPFIACAYYIKQEVEQTKLHHIEIQKKIEIIGVDTISDIISDIINIPCDINKLRDQSFEILLKDIEGYYNNADLVNEKNIEEALRKQPEAVEKWLLYSADRQKGWFFRTNNKDEYILGHLPNDNFIKERIFTDKFVACAQYINNEIVTSRLKFIMKIK